LISSPHGFIGQEFGQLSIPGETGPDKSWAALDFLDNLADILTQDSDPKEIYGAEEQNAEQQGGCSLCRPMRK
jgi:hypothetical protein